jgi:hypothetical protein
LTVTTAETRKARSFLFSKHRKGFRIPPRKFAASARELGVGFRELLKLIGRRYLRGQDQQSIRQEAIQAAAERGT